MHFLSAGRDDRIHRWIAELPQSQWRLSLTSVQSAHRNEHDALESIHRKEHDAVVDMEWELEELERQIALTASAFGRDWRTSMLSVDSLRKSLDLKSLKHSSQLTVRPEDLQGILDQVKAQDDARAEAALETNTAVAVEAAVALEASSAVTLEAKADVAAEAKASLDPIASLVPSASLQEFKGQDDAEGGVPLAQTNAEVALKGAALEPPSQAPLDDTVAGTTHTPNRRREGRIISQPPKFPPDEAARPNLSRSRTAPPPIRTSRTSASSSLPRPPITFILQESASPLPSAMHFTPTPLDLDAFPTTPRSFTSFVPGQREAPVQELLSPEGEGENELVVPAQELLSPSPTTPYDSTGGSEASTPSLSAFPATPASPWPVDRTDFPFPPPVPSLPSKSLASDDGDGDDGSVSGVSVEGQLSSRFSVFSSRFSVSSGSRSRAGSRATSRSRAGSRATSRSRAGSSATPVPPPPPPTASMRGLMMSVSQQLTRSRSHTMLPRLTIRTGTGHGPSASLSVSQSSRSAVDSGGRGWFGTVPAMPRAPAVPVPARTKSPALPALPKTPGTPVTPSSAVGAFFGRARTASLARKQRLVVSGVKRNEDCEENVRRWCENLSPVKRMWRAPGTENVYIHFQDKNAYKKIGGIEARQVSIPGVGTVALNCVSG